MKKGFDLSKLYQLRNDFIIIGLTGMTGSGVSDVARQLNKGFDSEVFPDPNTFTSLHNSYRKYRIIYNYSKENFKSFELISYKNILLLFILKYPFESFVSFIQSEALSSEFERNNLRTISYFQEEIKALESLQLEFSFFQDRFEKMDFAKLSSQKRLFYDTFFSERFKTFADSFFSKLATQSRVKRNKMLQVVANNLRKSGDPYKSTIEDVDSIFTIAQLINEVIKACKEINGAANVVIDSLRNPFEIMFFRQRFSAFYTISVNQQDKVRGNNIKKLYDSEYDDATLLFKDEYDGAKDEDFYRQKVKNCIQ